MGERLWGSEEFEDAVARALISLHETDVHIVRPPSWAKGAKLRNAFNVPSDKDFESLRRIGPYFPPHDRMSMEGIFDYENDGLPSFATLAFVPSGKNDHNEIYCVGYLFMLLARKVNRLPVGVAFPPGRNVAYYELTRFAPQDSGGVEAVKEYFAIRPTGECVFRKGGKRTDAAWGSKCLGFFTDARFLWNVHAVEGKARAAFGVHEEQIKSLFYSRSLPMTSAGRKRPILHWVSAHRRRINRGIDIDINKHLRGADSFVMDGTMFKITNPQKQARAA